MGDRGWFSANARKTKILVSNRSRGSVIVVRSN